MELKIYKPLGGKWNNTKGKIRCSSQLSWEANSGWPVEGPPQCEQKRQGSLSLAWPWALVGGSSKVPELCEHHALRITTGQGQCMREGTLFKPLGDSRKWWGWPPERQKDLLRKWGTGPEKCTTDCYLCTKAPDGCGLASVGNIHKMQVTNCLREERENDPRQ